MTPKDIDDSLLGFIQEIEPEVPKTVKKNVKVSAHPVTGEPVVERVKAPKKPKGNKMKGELKLKRAEA
eukprot:CAMPEP_0170458874 /NCGR_PEP_ID=MMETSP0123-20130129/5714_1 /TAXON_ID=182087 /ORGANISM="Favella ehrenbergii, Strain Fehren 1" /LENGTH=67 /DNA_ID=CAMNT_0010723199 /DNA_START=913 /DNA_END=1113 /DNA_ORIENTATION=+